MRIKLPPFRLLLALLVAALLLGGSKPPPAGLRERVRAYTRGIEFDFVSWTVNALAVKLNQLAIGTARYLPAEIQRQAVLDYLDIIRRIQEGENQLNDFYSDPAVSDPETATASLRDELADLYGQRARLGPVAEAVLQGQLNQVLDDTGLTLAGQAIPPVLYHTTPLPLALIISPREVIRQETDISLLPDLTIDQRADLEASIDQALNVSTLVVPIGGIGLYPTMVMQTSDINSLADVVAHEWTHNYLTLRPLGLNYLKNAELRTINETTASIVGKELGRAIVAAHYPEYLPPPPAPPPAESPVEPAPTPDTFDFRAEMRITRLNADRLLAEGKIEAAETYMELRRRFLWDHGYHIRKLNQAYFAFHGAYADQPGGAAGDDPIGAAVRTLRQQSPTLESFLKRIAWISSFEELLAAIEEG